MSVARRAAAPLLGVGVAAALLAATRGLDEVVAGGQLGPAFWPRLVLLGLALACVAKIAADARGPASPRPAGPAGPGEPRPISGARLGAAVALIVAYVLATEACGFALSTGAFIVAFLWLGGARSPLVLAVHAVGGTIALLYLFVKVVYLPLPKGAGPLEAVTLALYRALRIF